MSDGAGPGPSESNMYWHSATMSAAESGPGTGGGSLRPGGGAAAQAASRPARRRPGAGRAPVGAARAQAVGLPAAPFCPPAGDRV
jgi:hypothetical protein